MKPCAFDGQSLVDHAFGSVQAMRRFFGDSYFEVVSRRLMGVVGVDLNPGDVRQLVEFLVAYHDIGKAGRAYQEQFDDNCKARVEKPSFVFHEVGSALFLYKNEWTNGMLKALSVVAVLNHLNALRNIRDIEERLGSISSGHLAIGEFGSMLIDELGGRFSNPFMGTLDVSDYSVKDVVDMLNHLRELASRRWSALKSYVLLLAPIIVGDNLDSVGRRGEGRGRFAKLLVREVMGNEAG